MVVVGLSRFVNWTPKSGRSCVMTVSELRAALRTFDCFLKANHRLVQSEVKSRDF